MWNDQEQTDIFLKLFPKEEAKKIEGVDSINYKLNCQPLNQQLCLLLHFSIGSNLVCVFKVQDYMEGWDGFVVQF